MPAVSILVPCYNVEKFIHQCMDSIVNQTLKDIEIICINDGSKDSTLSILQEYADKDSRVRIIDKTNSGYGDSMNRGLEAATGEYIGIVESDDWAELDMFESLYALAKKHDCDMVKSAYSLYWSNPEKDVLRAAPQKFADRLLLNEEHSNCACFAPSIWSGIYRREMLERYGIRFLKTPGASFQDTGFYVKTWMVSRSIWVTSKAYLHYRQDNMNSSVKSRAKIFAIVYEYRSIEAFMKKWELDEKWYAVKDRMKFNGYWWNYHRLDSRGRRRFLPIMRKHFAEIMKNDNPYFSRGEKKKATLLIKHPRRFYIKNEIQDWLHGKRSFLSVQELKIFNHTVWRNHKDGNNRTTSLLGLQIYKRRVDTSKRVSILGVPVYRERIEGDFIKKRVLCFKFKTAIKRKIEDEASALSSRPSLMDKKLDILYAASFYQGPLVSIIIPVYNTAPYLRECLDSLLAQSLPAGEIICVDDGSTDGSLEILEEYAAKHSVMRILRGEHLGAGAARNKGLAIAQGKYLSILDSDDIYHPTMLFELVARAERFNVDVAVCRSCSLSPQKKIQNMPGTVKKSMLPDKEVFSLNDITKHSFQLFIGWSWDKLFRRSFIENYNLTFQNTRSTNDALFCFMAVQLASSISVVDEVLVTHRMHETSLAATRDKDPLCFIEAVEAIEKALRKHELYEKVERSFLNWVGDFCLWQSSTVSEASHKKIVAKLKEGVLPVLLSQSEDFFYNTHTRQELQKLADKA